MENYTQEEKYIKAQKRIKEIKGFYAHLFITILIIPFLIFINLSLVPEFHWFWFAAGGMTLGLLIHWFAVFGYSMLGLDSDWEQRKIREMMEKDNYQKFQ